MGPCFVQHQFTPRMLSELSCRQYFVTDFALGAYHSVALVDEKLSRAQHALVRYESLFRSVSTSQ